MTEAVPWLPPPVPPSPVPPPPFSANAVYVMPVRVRALTAPSVSIFLMSVFSTKVPFVKDGIKTVYGYRLSYFLYP